MSSDRAMDTDGPVETGGVKVLRTDQKYTQDRQIFTHQPVNCDWPACQSVQSYERRILIGGIPYLCCQMSGGSPIDREKNTLTPTSPDMQTGAGQRSRVESPT